jgi:chemotaxis signal transduction protein
LAPATEPISLEEIHRIHDVRSGQTEKAQPKAGQAAAQTATATKNQAMVTALSISALIAALVGMILYFLLARSAHPSR